MVHFSIFKGGERKIERRNDRRYDFWPGVWIKRISRTKSKIIFTTALTVLKLKPFLGQGRRNGGIGKLVSLLQFACVWWCRKYSRENQHFDPKPHFKGSCWQLFIGFRFVLHHTGIWTNRKITLLFFATTHLYREKRHVLKSLQLSIYLTYQIKCHYIM